MLRPSSPVCAKASPERPCYTLDRSAFVPCPERSPGAEHRNVPSPDPSRHGRSDLSVCTDRPVVQPANPAFTMSEIRERASRDTRSNFKFPSNSESISDQHRTWPATRSRESSEGWWSRSGSNRRPQACKARALPTELRPRGTRRRAEIRKQKSEV